MNCSVRHVFANGPTRKAAKWARSREMLPLPKWSTAATCCPTRIGGKHCGIVICFCAQLVANFCDCFGRFQSAALCVCVCVVWVCVCLSVCMCRVAVRSLCEGFFCGWWTWFDASPPLLLWSTLKLTPGLSRETFRQWGSLAGPSDELRTERRRWRRLYTQLQRYSDGFCVVPAQDQPEATAQGSAPCFGRGPAPDSWNFTVLSRPCPFPEWVINCFISSSYWFFPPSLTRPRACWFDYWIFSPLTISLLICSFSPLHSPAHVSKPGTQRKLGSRRQVPNYHHSESKNSS